MPDKHFNLRGYRSLLLIRRGRLSLGAWCCGCVLFLAWAAQPLAAGAKEWKQVVIATEGSYAPWNLTRPDGSLDGFEVELVKLLCSRLKLDCRLQAQGWNGMLDALQAGKFDMVMDAISITEERKRVIAFSRPYASTPATFAALKGGPLGHLPGTGTKLVLSGDADRDATVIASLKLALKGRTIGIQSSTVYAKFIYQNFQSTSHISEYRMAAEHDFDLMAGRIDVVFDDATYFASLASEPGANEPTPTGPQLSGPVWGAGEGFGFRKSDPELKALFDRAIGAALADGSIARLSLKWLKIDVAP
jgi:octopine/nopaline transport system substrate-binding protein